MKQCPAALRCGAVSFLSAPSSFVSIPRRSCLPLSREVADPEGLPEGEIRRTYAKRDAQSRLIANSLPQSPAATAPSSEGAKGLGCAFRPPSPTGKKRSPAADAGLGCCRSHPLRGRTGGPGGISPLVQRPPGGLSVHFPPVESGRMPHRASAVGAPVDLTASVAAHSGSLRHDGGTRRRSPLCGQTAQARRGPRFIESALVARPCGLPPPYAALAARPRRAVAAAPAAGPRFAGAPLFFCFM